MNAVEDHLPHHGVTLNGCRDLSRASLARDLGGIALVVGLASVADADLPPLKRLGAQGVVQVVAEGELQVQLGRVTGQVTTGRMHRVSLTRGVRLAVARRTLRL